MAIVKSSQWEKAMRMYNEEEQVTAMELLIKSMPGLYTFCWWSDKLELSG